MKTHIIQVEDENGDSKDVTFEYRSEIAPQYANCERKNLDFDPDESNVPEVYTVNITTPLTIRENDAAVDTIMEFLGVKDTEEITFE